MKAFQWLEEGLDKKKIKKRRKKKKKGAKVHMVYKKKEKIKDSVTPLYAHTYTLPLYCVDGGKQEKAGPPDSTVMERYSRISLFVLVVSVKVKSSSQSDRKSPTQRHNQPLTHTLLNDYSYI